MKHIIKKMAIFFLIYITASILQQVILTGIFLAMGYNPMEGILPSENLQMLALYYCFAVYFPLIFLYCKFVEKRPLSSLGFNNQISDYLPSMIIADILLILIIGLCCLTGGISFVGINKNVNFIYIISLLGGFIVQGAAEETLVRGFLMTSLMQNKSAPAAIFWSATAFALPHFSNLFAGDVKYALIGIVNIYLISIIFSLLMLCRANIWISCGLHSIWNFLLYGVLGLALSGIESTPGIICFSAAESSIINGGSYGIESSIITTLILAITVMILCSFWTKRREE